MELLKAHWDFILVVFGFGGLVVHNKEHRNKTDKLELIIEKEIPEMKDMLARIDERTKKL